MQMSKQKLAEKARKYKFAPLIITIFALAVGLRYYPVRNMEYLQASDPYNLFRMAQHLAYEGNIPQLDFMRNFPYALPVYTVHLGTTLIPAILYWAGGSAFFENFLGFAQFTTPLFTGVSVLLMYFLGKELYDKYAGLGAAFFLSVIPATMQRSSAGFFEKEALATMFMMSSLLFFTLAWKKKSWPHGIISGLSLGLFTISWGGSQMLWLLYPMIVGFIVLIDRDIESVIAAYTPTVLIAAGFASIFNPGVFWFTDTLSILAIAFLALIWARYLAEELELISEQYLPYFGITSYLTGALLLVLSPLYSNTLAQIMLRIYRLGTQTGGSVASQTVSENAAPGMAQIASQLGPSIVGQLFPGAGLLSSLTGSWTLVFLAIPLMLTSIALMAAKRYSVIEGLEPKKNYSLIAGFIASWAVGLSVFIAGRRAYGIALMLGVSAIMAAIVYYLDEDAAFTITSMALIFAGVLSTLFGFREPNTLQAMEVVAYPVWAAVAGLGIIYRFDAFKEANISIDWVKVVPFLWLSTNLLGATARTRLIYLAAFPVALGAGYTLSIVLKKIGEIDFSKAGVNKENTVFAVKAFAIALVLSVNLLAGYAASQGISGSPNQAWMNSLDHMDEEIPNGSVVMSWWDYGYHFQSLGRTGSMADGGNFHYFVDGDRHVNQYLADYFTSTNTSNHTEFLEKHSSDYIVLDNTMIGKYQAVSQIARDSNENFYSMPRAYTSGALQTSVSQNGNRTVATFRAGPRGSPVVDTEPNNPSTRSGIPAEIYVPFERSNTSIDISDPATIRYYNGEQEKANCVLTEEGVKTFGDERTDYCIAEDPYYSFERGLQGTQTGVVLVPRDIVDHTLNRLYLMDGYGIPYVEKVEEGSNDYVKIWEVK